ncbi:MAG: DUF1559 domain-containing protein, partial [Thermoguttaceae bacterium]|nr:DUF1559 domain-containing protein [Thermoguttaceae bacterium]
MEQSALYDQVVQNVEAGNSPWTTGADIPWCQNIPSFMCPSDAAAKRQPGGLTATSYHINRGDVSNGWDWDEYRGAFSDGDIHDMTLSDFTDGTSNTITFSEVVVGAQKTMNRVKGGIAFLGGSFGDGNADFPYVGFTPTVCAGRRGANGVLTGDTNTNDGYGPGRRWADAQNNYTSFFTILAPNSPNCAIDSAENWCLLAASSNHSGGVNCVYADGSVRFISETIDCGDQSVNIRTLAPNQARPQDYGGPSPYGVWGALGTSSGGETVSL